MEKLVVEFTWEKAPDKVVSSKREGVCDKLKRGSRYRLRYILEDGTVKEGTFQHILQLNIDSFDDLTEDKFLKAVKEAEKAALLKDRSKEIVQRILDSISEQEDPDKRVVTKWHQVYNDCTKLHDVYITSSYDGWAEEKKKAFSTAKQLDVMPEELRGLTETDFYKRYYGSDFEELVRALDRLYSYSFEETAEVSSNDGCSYFKESPFIEYVEGLCCGELICSDGSCDYDGIRLLKKSGYDVFAGEKDSFGWLTGCVKKNGDDRILVYG